MSSHSIDLRRQVNSQCTRGCNKFERQEMTSEGVCLEAESAIDGMPVRCVGEWAYDKTYMLVRYFTIFVNGMRHKWDGKLGYIEICSGPGRTIRRDVGEEMDGTPIAIVRSPSFAYIHQGIFVDSNPEVVAALQSRLAAVDCTGKAVARLGDYTDPAGLAELLGAYDLRGLNLVFIDPTDCSVPYLTLLRLKDLLPTFDLVINVAMGTDIARNIKLALGDRTSTVRAKYEEFLGSAEFFECEENRVLAKCDKDKELRIRFIEAYRASLSRIGLVHFDAKKVRHYYYLVFASSSPRGLDFWHKVNLVTPQDQRLLF